MTEQVVQAFILEDYISNSMIPNLLPNSKD